MLHLGLLLLLSLPVVLAMGKGEVACVGGPEVMMDGTMILIVDDSMVLGVLATKARKLPIVRSQIVLGIQKPDRPRPALGLARPSDAW